MKNIFKKNLKLFLGIIIGVAISGVAVYAASGLMASEIEYNNTVGLKDDQGNDVNDVEGALNALYDKVDCSNSGSGSNTDECLPIDLSTFQANSSKTVLASSKGLCVHRNGTLNCFKINNAEEEGPRLKEVFSDIKCTDLLGSIICTADDYRCAVYANGGLLCNDLLNNSARCEVNKDGVVTCN